MADTGLVAVTNTTPVVALVGVGEIRLLDALFGRVVVPLEVWVELADKSGAPEADALLGLRSVVVLPTPEAPPEALHLDAGERAAIAFAMKQRDAVVLLDERRARHAAKELGLSVRGTLAILVEAKHRGLVRAVRPLVEKMVQNGCWLSETLIATVLRSVGEA